MIGHCPSPTLHPIIHSSSSGSQPKSRKSVERVAFYALMHPMAILRLVRTNMECLFRARLAKAHGPKLFFGPDRPLELGGLSRNRLNDLDRLGHMLVSEAGVHVCLHEKGHLFGQHVRVVVQDQDLAVLGKPRLVLFKPLRNLRSSM